MNQKFDWISVNVTPRIFIVLRWDYLERYNQGNSFWRWKAIITIFCGYQMTGILSISGCAKIFTSNKMNQKFDGILINVTPRILMLVEWFLLERNDHGNSFSLWKSYVHTFLGYQNMILLSICCDYARLTSNSNVSYLINLAVLIWNGFLKTSFTLSTVFDVSFLSS